MGTKRKQPEQTFRAFWPIHDSATEPARSDEDLIRLAAADFRDVAARHSAQITGPGNGYIAPGRTFPGAYGAAQVVVIEAPAKPITRPYR